MGLIGWGALARALGALALVAAALWGLRACQEALREEGREQVRSAWRAADQERALADQAARQKKQDEARAEELRMTREKEANDVQDAQRETALRERAAAAERAAERLRHVNQRLIAERRGAGGDAAACPAAQREADATARALELFGACAQRYGALAARAGKLAGQVIGLQDHIIVLQPAAGALLSEVRDDD